MREGAEGINSCSPLIVIYYGFKISYQGFPILMHMEPFAP